MKALVNSLLSRLGYRIVRADANPSASYGLHLFLSFLKQRGFSPNHVIDVGANKGNWTRSALRFFPDARYTLIEPQSHLRGYVQDLIDLGYKIEWITAGAGDEQANSTFTVSHRDDSSSFVPQQGMAAGQQQISVPVRTLNEIVSASQAPVPDLVKIDAEGYDLRVLAGASELVGKTEVFFVEAMVCAPEYENSLPAVVGRMADLGYAPVDVTDLNRSPKHGVLWTCEIAFLREGSQLLENVTSYQ